MRKYKVTGIGYECDGAPVFSCAAEAAWDHLFALVDLFGGDHGLADHLGVDFIHLRGVLIRRTERFSRRYYGKRIAANALLAAGMDYILQGYGWQDAAGNWYGPTNYGYTVISAA